MNPNDSDDDFISNVNHEVDLLMFFLFVFLCEMSWIDNH